MATFGAYAVTLLVGQWILTLVMFLATAVLIGAIIRPLMIVFKRSSAQTSLMAMERFVAGGGGAFTVVWLASLLFHWLLGAKSFGLLPFAACVASLIPPFRSDWKYAIGLKDWENQADQVDPKLRAAFARQGTSNTVMASFCGYFVGLVTGYILCVSR